jgi:hypothetical protein
MGQRDENPFKRRSRSWYLLLVLLLLLFLGALFGRIEVAPDLWREEGYVCAVCGRERTTHVYFGLGFIRITASPATVCCDRVIGSHKHIWLWDYSNTILLKADGFAYRDVPICDIGVAPALARLAETPYLTPVVQALCDVDNWFALLARDILPSCPPPWDQSLQAWWEENKRWFQVEHDKERALKVFDDIYTDEKADEEFYDLWDGVRKARANLDRFGAPTEGALR